MNPLDDGIREKLRRSLDEVTPVTAGRLDAVREQHRRSSGRRRGLAAAAAAAVVALGAGTTAVLVNSGGTPDHTGTDSPVLPHPLRVVGSWSAAELGLQQPERAAMGAGGRMYVTDSVSQTVTAVSPEGAVLDRWGAPGSGPGQFRLDDGGIAVGPDGRVYVADSGNGRVQVFEPDGTFVNQLGEFGDGPGQFEWPWAIAVGPDDSVYVGDDRAATLTKLSADGREEWRLGEPGTPEVLVGHDHFGGFDSRGRLVLGNDDSGFVLYLDPDGTLVDQFGTGASGDHMNTLSHPPASDFPDGACDTTVGPDDIVYVTGCVADQDHGLLVQAYDPGHVLVAQWVDSPLITAPRFGAGSTAVAVGADGSLFLLAPRS
jgi:hypothetical protein